MSLQDVFRLSTRTICELFFQSWFSSFFPELWSSNGSMPFYKTCHIHPFILTLMTQIQSGFSILFMDILTRLKELGIEPTFFNSLACLCFYSLDEAQHGKKFHHQDSSAALYFFLCTMNKIDANVTKKNVKLLVWR